MFKFRAVWQKRFDVGGGLVGSCRVLLRWYGMLRCGIAGEVRCRGRFGGIKEGVVRVFQEYNWVVRANGVKCDYHFSWKLFFFIPRHKREPM